jgi:ABC-type uncharacterized transport system involved in gliding motility auxiliary subunit
MKKYLQKLDTLGLLLLVAAVIWYSVSNIWEKWNIGLAIAGGVLIIIGVAANYRQIIGTFGKRSTKYALNYVISIILVIAIISGVNYIGQRHVKRWDTTGNSQFTLAPQTAQILQKLKGDVDIQAFYPGGDDPRVKELLTEYKALSRRIRFKFIDPDRQPDVAKQNEVTVYGTVQNPFSGTSIKFGTVLVAYGNRTEKIEKRSEEVQEEDITNAIIRAGRSEAKKVYFIQGHGEKDIADTERTGYSEAKKILEAQGYKVENLHLATTGIVPDDARVLVAAGPKVEFFPPELQLINDYLGKGGAGMLVLVDPMAPSLQPFLSNWAIQVDNDVVLDNSNEGRLMGSTVPIVRSYENHKITENFNLTTIFPVARSIQPAKTIPNGITVETLFKSNANSWGETDLDSLKTGVASNDRAKDLPGPLSLAVAEKKEIKPQSEGSQAVSSRLVVVGTSNFPMNSAWSAGGNGNLFMNMISWLAQDEDLISIRPKPPEDRRMMLSQGQMYLIRLIAIFLLPGTALVVGIVVVVKRRRK